MSWPSLPETETREIQSQARLAMTTIITRTRPCPNKPARARPARVRNRPGLFRQDQGLAEPVRFMAQPGQGLTRRAREKPYLARSGLEMVRPNSLRPTLGQPQLAKKSSQKEARLNQPGPGPGQCLPSSVRVRARPVEGYGQARYRQG